MSSTPLIINSVAHTPADIITMLQERVASLKAVEAARAVLATQVASSRLKLASTKAIVAGVQHELQTMYGNDSGMLADFGLKPRKPTGRKTVDTLVTAAEKAKATRKARHTLGKKQKAKIKGKPPQPAK